MSITVEEALVKIFSNGEKPQDVLKEIQPNDINALESALCKMYQTICQEPLTKSDEVLKTSSNGQWSLEKAIKPGPTLDYGKIAPEQNPLSNPKAAKEAKAARLADQEANAPSIDYGNNRMAVPKVNAGLADKAKAVRAKIEAESKETALETIQRKQKMNKP